MSALTKKAAKKTSKQLNRSKKSGKAVKALSKTPKAKPKKAAKPAKLARPAKPTPAKKKITAAKTSAVSATGASRRASSASLRSQQGARKHAPARPQTKHAKAKRTHVTKSTVRKPGSVASLKAKAQDLKEKERLKKQREREKLAKAREQDRSKRQKEVERTRKQKEAERLKKQREQDSARAARAKEAEKRAKEDEKKKKQQERELKRQAEIRAREEEKRRQQLEREDAKRAKEEERQRQKAEREAEREQAKRQKEEERAKREAEREAYRKAKEAERERIRAARDAQKRALEGRIAEATRNANKLGGGRSTTTRFYSPRAIPNQSGTTRRVTDMTGAVAALNIPTNGSQALDSTGGVHDTAAVNALASVSDDTPRIQPPPERPLPTPESVEERYRIIEERLKEAPADFRHNYQEALDMSWIYHDSALEGVVYTFQELRAAIDQGSSAIADSSLQPVVEEVRRHKAAIDLVRELGEKKRAPITVDVIRKIYLTLHPEEGDLKTVKYRRDIPQHRLYFHEYAHPDKIQHKVRQIVDWLNGPEPKKLKSPIRVASRAHYELLRVFPFQTDSGKVARLFMNLLLLRSGHPPAIVHSTERQRYYEALRGALPTLIQMVTESILNGLVSIEKLLDEHDIKMRAAANPA